MNNETKMPEHLARFIAMAIVNAIELMGANLSYKVSKLNEEELKFYLEDCQFDNVADFIVAQRDIIKNYPPIPNN